LLRSSKPCSYEYLLLKKLFWAAAENRERFNFVTVESQLTKRIASFQIEFPHEHAVCAAHNLFATLPAFKATEAIEAIER
jgi:hypothetical protein